MKLSTSSIGGHAETLELNKAFLAPSQEKATLNARYKYYPKSLAGTSEAPSALQANERQIKMKGLQQ